MQTERGRKGKLISLAEVQSVKVGKILKYEKSKKKLNVQFKTQSQTAL